MFSSENWFGASAGFYNGVATQSLRFDDGSSAFLSRTPAGASTNLKAFTFSTWVKRSSVSGASHTLFSAGANSNDVTMIRFEGNGITDTQLSFFNYTSGSLTTTLKTKAKFRDSSAWYNIIVACDTTQSGANKAKIYVNGVLVDDWHDSSHDEYPNDNSTFQFGNNVVHRLGSLAYSTTQLFDGYMAETNFVENTQLAPSVFGELKNGVWIPIAPSPTYGTNGFRLQFEDNAVGTPENEGVVEDDNIGRDSSGEHNHFTSSGIVASDCAMPDSPENNFCTWNPLSNTGVTLSEGNLQTSGGSNKVCGGTMAVTSGKWYWECKLKSTVNGSNPVILGFVSANTIAHAANFEQGVYFYTDNENGKTIVHVENNSATQTITVPSAMLPIAVDEVMQYAYDGDTGKIWFGIENVWADNSGGTTGNPSTGANPTFTLADTSIFMTPLRDHAGVAWTGLANFGQLSNDYTAPTDFNSLSTANLPEPTIGPNSGTNEQADDYFNTVLWTGGSGDVAVSGVGFKPDWVWIKARSNAQGHSLVDSSRGGTKLLQSNSDGAENSVNSGNDVNEIHFTDDGFTSNTDWHTNNYTYVAWNWKVNGSITSSVSGGTNITNGTSGNATVQANTTSGISIVTFQNTIRSTDFCTFPHGLGAKPDMVILKSRDSANYWAINHSAVGLQLGFLGGNGIGDDAFVSSTFWNTINDTTVKFQSNGNLSGTNEDIIAYVFHSVEGYSKFGSYTGNGSTDGTFIFLGFRPSWVMVKKTDGSATWWIIDAVRDVDNVTGKYLMADSANQESNGSDYTSFDFLSNGFKIRNTSTAFNSGTHIYMAFAEAPFKYANAR